MNQERPSQQSGGLTSSCLLWTCIIVLWIGSLIFVGVAAFGGGVLVQRGGAVPSLAAVNVQPDSNNEPDQFKVFWEAWKLVKDNFVDRAKIDDKQMTYGAIRGMLDTLSDQGHTRFLTPDELKASQEGLSGRFSGIGAQVGQKDGHPVIIAPFPDSPAQKAGIRPGDIILKVDGEDTLDQPLDVIISKIRGPAGKPVTLTIQHENDNTSQDITIVRGDINVPIVTWRLIPGTQIAHIQISQFAATANTQLVKAINDAKKAGAKALVVDVRNDPGGLLDQAVDVTSQFLKGGLVLQEQDSKGNRRRFPVRSGGVATDIPMVVLINEGTASASEIFAGAIKENGRAKLIGTKTFGTGTVLSTFNLSDGSALLLGTSMWLTPNGNLIKGNGITPDEEVHLPDNISPIFPDGGAGLDPQDIQNRQDTQLTKAIEDLQSMLQQGSSTTP
ncbi:MAG: S41 family peptidase [Chloroflexi bacterium]|nr:S41 family peptidase [Chloroflexota bacterium]